MTEPFPVTDTCALCGATGEFYSLASTSAFGSPDLDTRPPEPHRSSMEFWVRRCAGCGYCAPELGEAKDGVREIVASEEYRALVGDGSVPELANRFLCWSMIQEKSGEAVGAGWAALQAAWVCDDEKAGTAARRCRERAIELFTSVRGGGGSFAQEPGAEEAVLADLYRRVGHFDEVLLICEAGLRQEPDEVIRAVLAFEVQLTGRRDRSGHQIDEAMAARG